jgi:hypothetical protein
MNPLNDSMAWGFAAGWWAAAVIAAGWIAVAGAQLGRARAAAVARVTAGPARRR